MGSEILTKSATEIATHVQKGDVSAVDIARASLAAIAKHEPSLHAFLYVDAEGALASAAAVDRARAAGETLGPLAGVPIALKDNLCVRGTPTTCASKILEGWIAPYDADVVTRLRAAGATIVGKANMDEFAMGSSNENSAYGSVHNPWDLSRAPGGSSGGSATSVASGVAAIALGSDTGGSVRQPGSFTGTVAFKPTYGRVSRYGLIAFASSLDQIGPFSRTVRDAARVSRVIAGHDGRDATSADVAVPDYETALSRSPRGVRVGVVRSALGEGCDEAVRAAIEAAIDVLAKLGCSIVDVELPTAAHAVSAYYIIAPAECSSNLARFDGMRYGPRAEGSDLTEVYGRTRSDGFGPEVKRRIMLGTYVLSAGYYDAYYAKAQKARTLIARDYGKAFETCNLVLSPTSPSAAFPLGSRTKDPLAMYLADIYTLPPSLAGLPAISVPCGFDGSLPVGLQLTGKAFDEEGVLALAHAYEQACPWKDRHPPIFA